MEFDCQLKYIFLDRNMKQKEFAAAIGIVPGTMSQIANSKQLPSFDVMFRICEELNMDVRDIWKRRNR